MNYTVGTQYLSSGKHPHVCTVIDMWITHNLTGVIVKTQYVTIHEFMGQMVTERDVCAVTIAKGIAALQEARLVVLETERRELTERLQSREQARIASVGRNER